MALFAEVIASIGAIWYDRIPYQWTAASSSFNVEIITINVVEAGQYLTVLRYLLNNYSHLRRWRQRWRVRLLNESPQRQQHAYVAFVGVN